MRERFRFLFVDDDEEQCLRVQRALATRSCAHPVHYAMSGAEAMDHLRRWEYSGVVLDWHLGDMTAGELIDLADIQLPIGILTATGYDAATAKRQECPQILRVLQKSQQYLDDAVAMWWNDWLEATGRTVYAVDPSRMLQGLRG